MKIIPHTVRNYDTISGIYNLSPEGRLKLYRMIGTWAKRKGIQTIAGPVASGVIISEGVGTVMTQRGHRVNTISVPKKGYVRHGYGSNGIKGAFNYPTLFVDDVISSGATMEHTLKIFFDYVFSRKTVKKAKRFVEKENIYIITGQITSGFQTKHPYLKIFHNLDRIFKIVK